MPDFAREVTGSAGYRVPVDDPSVKGAHARDMIVLQERLRQADEGGGSGGGFRLDVEQMQTLLPQWKDLRDTLGNLRASGEELRAVRSPADDEASRVNNTAAKTHAELYRNSIKRQWEYASQYVLSLEKMIDRYRRDDESSADSFNVMGTDL
ncbi:hypothetical protein [Amycolatopsis sp. CA-128772]|uniref:hypothetical protein n=1 Tax=Amycolatopsis sp. CA-128772 TaxID=2073159 RepID=UPI000CD0CAE2|nr:hypothetical protein [Amycolatopsis sp. CA-128772]